MSNIYIPAGCQTLDKSSAKQQIRLGIQGFPKTGKTWAALTFPNPIVLNLDRGLGAHVGRADVIEVPFYKPEFAGNAQGELKDKIMEWLLKEGPKLSDEQTLVFDGSTSLQNAYHIWFRKNMMRFLTKAGKVDDFAEYREKKNYFGEIMEVFKSLKCNIVYIAHETPKTDKEGSYTGKIRPLLSGQFQDEIVSHFTDWFRQFSNDKPTDFNAVKPETLRDWGVKTAAEFKTICDTFSKQTLYYWLTESDATFDGGGSSLVNFPRYMAANYQTFKQYQRK